MGDESREAHASARAFLIVRNRSTVPPSGHTGRHLVLFGAGADRGDLSALQQATGLRIGSSSANQGAGRAQDLVPGEGVVFPRLRAALLHADPDQVQALKAHADAHSLLVEPERFVRATGSGAYSGVATQGSSSSENSATMEAASNPGSLPSASLANAPPVQGGVALTDTAQATWALQATGVLASSYAGRGVRIAILDTGLDLSHPDFTDRTIVVQSFVAGLTAADANGHGTHCVGIACGPLQPQQGPRYGVAFASEIYVGRVLDDSAGGTDGSILAGIDWAVQNGCAIVSMSLGSPVLLGDAYSPIFEQVAVRALAAGSLLIAAAGNESERPDSIVPVEHPANCPSILAIGAVDCTFAVAPFSNGGLNPDGGEVDLAAPGVAVMSSWLRPTLYESDSGTSTSTPHVAGIGALLAEANPLTRGNALRALLLQAYRRLPLPARDVGAGLIQAL
jgi:subtilisin